MIFCWTKSTYCREIHNLHTFFSSSSFINLQNNKNMSFLKYLFIESIGSYWFYVFSEYSGLTVIKLSSINFILMSVNFMLILQNHPISMLYLLDMTFWLDVFSSISTKRVLENLITIIQLQRIAKSINIQSIDHFINHQNNEIHSSQIYVPSYLFTSISLLVCIKTSYFIQNIYT